MANHHRRLQVANTNDPGPHLRQPAKDELRSAHRSLMICSVVLTTILDALTYDPAPNAPVTAFRLPTDSLSHVRTPSKRSEQAHPVLCDLTATRCLFDYARRAQTNDVWDNSGEEHYLPGAFSYS